jgi:hypothetical protein
MHRNEEFLMEIPDFLFATLGNLSLFTMSSRLRIKLQIGKEMTQTSAPDDRCHLNAKFTIPSGSRLRAQKLKITYLLSHQGYIRTTAYYGNRGRKLSGKVKWGSEKSRFLRRL